MEIIHNKKHFHYLNTIKHATGVGFYAALPVDIKFGILIILFSNQIVLGKHNFIFNPISFAFRARAKKYINKHMYIHAAAQHEQFEVFYASDSVASSDLPKD